MQWLISGHQRLGGRWMGTDGLSAKWISVEERLPEPGVVVLVHSKLGCTYFSHRLYNHINGKPFCIEYSGGWEVTHWMPLPEPPMEDNYG